MVLQCINGVSSNPVEGRTKIGQLKDLILTLFGLIFRRICMCVCVYFTESEKNINKIKITRVNIKTQYRCTMYTCWHFFFMRSGMLLNAMTFTLPDETFSMFQCHYKFYNVHNLLNFIKHFRWCVLLIIFNVEKVTFQNNN